jgi:hypothetical protein
MSFFVTPAMIKNRLFAQERKERMMKERMSIKEKLARLMMATTFAGVNEQEIALEMLTEKSKKRLQKRPQRRIETRVSNRPVLMA